MRSIFIFFLCFILFWVKESKAEQVIITTAKNPDFARIVFQWKRPVRHTFLLQDRTIKLRFGRKIEAQFQLPSKKLPGYISSVKPEADGKGLVFELNSNFDAYSYNAGSAIIVEIEGDPIELKKPVSNTLQSKETKSNKRKNIDRKIIDPSKNGAKSKEKVRLRFAEHSNYTRIVFDWPQTVKYSFNKKGGGVFIQFEKAADLEVSRLKRKPPRLVGEVKTIDSEQSALIAFAVPKTSKVRHFLSGSKVAVVLGYG